MQITYIEIVDCWCGWNQTFHSFVRTKYNSGWANCGNLEKNSKKLLHTLPSLRINIIWTELNMIQYFYLTYSIPEIE